MNDAPSIPKRRMSTLLKVVIGFGVVGVLVVIAFAIWRAGLASANDKRLKAILVSGEPVTARDLDAWYEKVDPAENAAVIWLAGIDKLQPPLQKTKPAAWSMIKSPARGKRFDPDALKEATEIVSQNKEALALFRRAAMLKKSRYPVDLTQSVYSELPHLSPLKEIAQFLRIEALLHAQGNHQGEAVESIKAILGAGGSLAQEPVLMSQLVRIAICSIAVITTERVLNLVPLTEPQLASLQAAFADMEAPDVAYRALVGERASSVTVLNSPHEIKPPPKNSEAEETVGSWEQGFGSPFVRLTGFFQRDLGFYLDAMGANIAISKLSDPERFISRTNLDAIELRARRGYYIMSSVLLPALSKTISRDVEHRARARVAQAAMAVERYRLVNLGKMPPTLAALVPKFLSAVPVDPFDGEAIRFSIRPKGYVVYSVGPDGTDDDGAERPPNNRAGANTPYDITFIMER